MNEIIIKLNDSEREVQVLNINDNNRVFKRLDGNKFYELVKEFYSGKHDEKCSKPKIYTNKYIMCASNDMFIINQPEHKRIVTYRDKGYNINFPNSIYVIQCNDSQITNIVAFAYEKFEEYETKLYKYPMPNMLNGDAVCIGTAPREVNNDIINALENIIYTQYTHASVNNIKSFNGTDTYFQYLQYSKFPYNLLIPSNRSLYEFIEVIK